MAIGLVDGGGQHDEARLSYACVVSACTGSTKGDGLIKIRVKCGRLEGFVCRRSIALGLGAQARI